MNYLLTAVTQSSTSISDANTYTPTETYRLRDLIIERSSEVENMLKKTIPPMAMDANTYLYDDGIGHLCIANYKNGKYRGRAFIFPSVVDVKVIDNEERKEENKKSVVIVSFADGTEEKAVTHKNDSFNIEQGISVCITKKLLSDASCGNSTAAYNKLIKHCVRINERNRKEEAKKKAEDAAEKAAAKRKYDKIVAKKKRRAERKREQEIEDMAEAIARAAKLTEKTE